MSSPDKCLATTLHSYSDRLHRCVFILFMMMHHVNDWDGGWGSLKAVWRSRSPTHQTGEKNVTEWPDQLSALDQPIHRIDKANSNLVTNKGLKQTLTETESDLQNFVTFSEFFGEIAIFIFNFEEAGLWCKWEHVSLAWKRYPDRYRAGPNFLTFFCNPTPAGLFQIRRHVFERKMRSSSQCPVASQPIFDAQLYQILTNKQQYSKFPDLVGPQISWTPVTDEN